MSETSNFKYSKYLDMALDTLFRDIIDNGFWNGEVGAFVKEMNQDSDGNLHSAEEIDYRYGPFGLMGVLYWRYRSNSSKYDYKIYK